MGHRTSGGITVFLCGCSICPKVLFYWLKDTQPSSAGTFSLCLQLHHPKLGWHVRKRQLLGKRYPQTILP